jgi:hypothetical protein
MSIAKTATKTLPFARHGKTRMEQHSVDTRLRTCRSAKTATLLVVERRPIGSPREARFVLTSNIELTSLPATTCPPALLAVEDSTVSLTRSW